MTLPLIDIPITEEFDDQQGEFENYDASTIMPNLIPNSNFEITDAPWAVRASEMLEASATRTTEWSMEGDYSMRMTAIHPNDSVTRTVGLAYAIGALAIPIHPSQTYTVSAYVHTVDGSESGGYRVGIFWYTNTGAEISFETGPLIPDVGLDGDEISHTFTAPNDAYYARPNIDLESSTANDVLTFDLDRIILVEGPSTETSLLRGQKHINIRSFISADETAPLTLLNWEGFSMDELFDKTMSELGGNAIISEGESWTTEPPNTVVVGPQSDISNHYGLNFVTGPVQTSFTITHNLNMRDIHTVVFENATGRTVYPTIERVDENNIRLQFDVAPTEAEYRAIVLGSFNVSANVGDGASTSIAVQHDLSTQNVLVTVYRNSSPWETIWCDVQHTDDNNILLNFSSPPTLDEFRVIITEVETGTEIISSVNVITDFINLGMITGFVSEIGDGVNTEFVVDHNLGTLDVMTSLYRGLAPFEENLCTVERISTNSVRLTFSSPPALNEYKILVIQAEGGFDSTIGDPYSNSLESIWGSINLEEFTDNDYISVALPSFPANGVELENSFIGFTSGSDFTSGVEVPFSASVVPLIDGDSELRFARSLLNDESLDLSAITGVRFTFSVTDHITIRIMAIRLLGPDWQSADMDINTNNERLYSAINRTGRLDSRADFPIAFRSDAIESSRAPMPINGKLGAVINAGSLQFTPNTFSFYMRERAEDYITQFELNTLTQSNIEGTFSHQPDYGRAVYSPRLQYTIDGLTQEELDGISQSDLDRVPNNTFTIFNEVRLTWTNTTTQIMIRDSNTSEDDYYVFSLSALSAYKNYYLTAEIKDRAIRVTLHLLDDFGVISTEELDTNWITNPVMFKRRRGRVGYSSQLADGTAFIEAVRAHQMMFAELRTNQFESTSPVEGVRIYAEGSPDKEATVGIQAGPFGGIVALDTTRANSADGSIKVTSTGVESLAGIQTSLIPFEDFENSEIVFDLFIESADLYLGGGLTAFLVNDRNRFFPTVLERLSSDVWKSYHIRTTHLSPQPAGKYRLVLVQKDIASIAWWIDNIRMISRNVEWFARSGFENAWGGNQVRYMPAKGLINDASDGIRFPDRGRFLEVKAQAYRHAAYIRKFSLKPKYAEFGNFSWQNNSESVNDFRLEGAPYEMGINITPPGTPIDYPWSVGAPAPYTETSGWNTNYPAESYPINTSLTFTANITGLPHDPDNMAPHSSFESVIGTGLQGWTLYRSEAEEDGSTLTWDRTRYMFGTSSARLKGGGINTAIGVLSDTIIPVSPGATYCLSFYSRAATTTREFGGRLTWYSIFDIGTEVSGPTVSNSNSNFVRNTFYWTAPGTASYVRISPVVYAPALEEVHWIDGVQFEEASVVSDYEVPVTIDEYRWDMGDGTVRFGKTVVHSYNTLSYNTIVSLRTKASDRSTYLSVNKAMQLTE